jgi:bifunctional non-homologous end joining protein LigD
MARKTPKKKAPRRTPAGKTARKTAKKAPSRQRSLKVYQAKRDFTKSPEPAGRRAGKVKKATAKPSSPREHFFCVQKHDASRLHYDFRLEHGGVLLSWAVPKGPSLNPSDKRLAMRVEDHPLDYGDFEGVIPSGYGAGTVLLWDRGSWTPEDGFTNVDKALKDGELKFSLNGTKLKGSWVLVRTRGRPGQGERESWLLIKHRDDWSGPIDVTKVAPDSVKSFQSIEAIAAQKDAAEWESHR